MTGSPGQATTPAPAGGGAPGDARRASAPARTKVAYVMSRFPKLSETFVVNELVAVERHGIDVELYPLLRERGSAVHPQAAEWADRAHYLPFLSLPIVASQLHFLRRRPRRYLRAALDVLRGTFGSLNFFVGAVGIFPKVAHAARLMEADGVTHVHCHFANHPALAGFVVHRLTDIPFSFTAHGSDLHVDRRMLREKVREAAFAVAVSDYNRGVLLAEAGAGASGKVVVIHCGVDTAQFHPEPRRAAPGTCSIACIGTLHEVKGQRFLVEACARLAERGIAFRCTIVGDGPDRGLLERLIGDLSLGERVVLAGPVTQDHVARILGQADVLVAPSVPTSKGKREGIPVVLMEALAAGVAVVASDLSGIPELVIDGVNGILVPPGDTERIADALGTLALDPDLRARLGKAGRQTVLRGFDLDTNAGLLAQRFAAGSGG